MKAGLLVRSHRLHPVELGGTKGGLVIVKESGIDPNRVVMDHDNQITMPFVKETDCVAGFGISPIPR